MTELWPRNIVPVDDNIVRLLASDRSLALYLAALDRPVPPSDLVRITGRPREDAERTATEMIGAGLLRIVDGHYVAGKTHLREEDLDAAGRGPFHLAVLNIVQSAVDETRHAVRMRRDKVRAGIGLVTLPDRPEALARAAAILAEAEDQLRGLQEELPPNETERRVRVVMFVGSTSDTVTP